MQPGRRLAKFSEWPFGCTNRLAGYPVVFSRSLALLRHKPRRQIEIPSRRSARRRSALWCHCSLRYKTRRQINIVGSRWRRWCRCNKVGRLRLRYSLRRSRARTWYGLSSAARYMLQQGFGSMPPSTRLEMTNDFFLRRLVSIRPGLCRFHDIFQARVFVALLEAWRLRVGGATRG